MIKYSQILSTHYKDSQWTLVNEEYESLEWYSSTAKPTQSELDALWASTVISIENEIVKHNRRNAYVSESDPIFFKMQRGEATLDEWKNKIDEINAKFPYLA